ncbi:MAG: hypothetical protein LLG14_22520 [Nocardiaceae bacterium]|nr:hypothetical protein [Nocardiaceae bacterium]
MIRSGVMVELRGRVRSVAEKVDDQRIRNARRLIRAMRKGEGPDVVYFGESTVSWIAGEDVDRRPLHRIVADGLGPTVSSVAIHGGSYHADLLSRFARILTLASRPPVVIAPLWVRGRFNCITQHPVYGHRQVMPFIDNIDLGGSLLRVHQKVAKPSAEEFEAFYRIPFPTIAGDLTIGDYVSRLKDPVFSAEAPAERSKLIFAYHQCSSLATGGELDAVERFGAALRALDCPVVTYQTPISVETGERHYGGAIKELIHDNFAILNKAYEAGLSRDASIILSGTTAPENYFVDPDLADEHLNERGRRWLAEQIVEQVQCALSAR